MHKWTTRSLSLLAFSFCALTALAQVPERVLLPVVIYGEVPGAHGSRWTTELVGHNAHSEYVQVSTETPSRRCLITCPRWPAEAKSNFQLTLAAPTNGSGLFLYVYPPADKVMLNLRVQDVSRQAQTWGTELPLIRERDTFTSAVHLIHIPLDERFRQTLRIYDFDGPANRAVEVRIYRDNERTPAVTSTMPLTNVAWAAKDPVYPEVPGYAQVNDLALTYPALVGAQRARVEIVPAQGMRIWAFVSVTNNETQHVTTITPRH